MAAQINKQPNGRYALWNTIVDAFSALDMTREEIIDEFVERNGRKAPEAGPRIDEAERALLIAQENLERTRIGNLVDALDDGTIEKLRPSWGTWDEHIAWLDGDYNRGPGEGKKMAAKALEIGTKPVEG